MTIVKRLRIIIRACTLCTMFNKSFKTGTGARHVSGGTLFLMMAANRCLEDLPWNVVAGMRQINDPSLATMTGSRSCASFILIINKIRISLQSVYMNNDNSAIPSSMTLEICNVRLCFQSYVEFLISSILFYVPNRKSSFLFLISRI